MELSKFYEMIHMDYNQMLQRLGSDERMYKYLKIFIKDNNFVLLKESLLEKDYENAFRAVHTIKGIAANLGFQNLYESACTLTEILRGEVDLQQVNNSFSSLEEAYEELIDLMKQLDFKGSLYEK